MISSTIENMLRQIEREIALFFAEEKSLIERVKNGGENERPKKDE